jgi:hypothetical protein
VEPRSPPRSGAHRISGHWLPPSVSDAHRAVDSEGGGSHIPRTAGHGPPCVEVRGKCEVFGSPSPAGEQDRATPGPGPRAGSGEPRRGRKSWRNRGVAKPRSSSRESICVTGSLPSSPMSNPGLDFQVGTSREPPAAGHGGLWEFRGKIAEGIREEFGGSWELLRPPGAGNLNGALRRSEGAAEGRQPRGPMLTSKLPREPMQQPSRLASNTCSTMAPREGLTVCKLFDIVSLRWRLQQRSDPR